MIEIAMIWRHDPPMLGTLKLLVSPGVEEISMMVDGNEILGFRFDGAELWNLSGTMNAAPGDNHWLIMTWQERDDAGCFKPCSLTYQFADKTEMLRVVDYFSRHDNELIRAIVQGANVDTLVALSYF